MKDPEMNEKLRTHEVRMLQFFQFGHLPNHLAEMSAPFAVLALYVVDQSQGSPERTVALRKLLEAKDAAVRSLLYEAWP